MSNMEEIELERHRKQMSHDVHALVEKYRAIFDWDIPGIDQDRADQLIVQALQEAFNELSQKQPNVTS